MKKRSGYILFLAAVFALTVMGCRSTATITEDLEPMTGDGQIDMSKPAEEEAEKEEEAEHGIVHDLFFYIPNRVLDVADMVRLKARVGPGNAAGVRITTLADLYVGSYLSAFVGLPGPRMRSIPKLPLGIETYNGIKVSLADATLDGFLGPDYSPTEVGVSLHFVFIGLDAGIDPVEILDCLGGFFFLNYRDDDF